MEELKNRILDLAMISRGFHVKGTDLYNLLVEGRYITRATSGIRVTISTMHQSKGKFIRIRNKSGRVVFSGKWTELMSQVEEF